ncbi:MAG: hypothetical protein AB1490_02905 [Pseudomonadota bacterium]
MFDDLKYRWALHKFLKEHRIIRQSYDETPSDPEELAGDELRIKYTMGRELNMQEVAIDAFRSRYLLEQAYKYHVPVPSKEEDWMHPRYADQPYLTPEAAQKLRADIRAEQKTDWDYWANRVTLGLGLIGSIFGVPAFFKK